MLTADSIPGALAEHRERIRSLGVRWIGVFGSFARGEEREESDIDILVRFARKKSLFSLVRIEDELARALGMKVDLVTENAVSPYLADAIYRDAVVIYDASHSSVISLMP